MDKFGDVKLGNCGLAKELDSDSPLAQTFCGTPLYMVPELVRRTHYGTAAALGCLVYELAALRLELGENFSAGGRVAR